MTDARLERLLARAGDDGRAEAEARAWPVAREAFAQRKPAGRTPALRRPLLAVACVAALCIVVALAATKPGSAVADWVHDHILGKPGVHKSAPALTHVPGGGRLLVRARQGVWVVSADGSRRLLSGYRGGTWSPRGLYLGVWRGHELSAVEPGGKVHWTLARPQSIHAADWSPDGYRVAYIAGSALRVVAGDGTGDGLIRKRVVAVAPAWRPRSPHLLAVVARPRVIDVVATDVKALAWRRRVAEPARALAWSPDGRLLAVAGRTTVTILDGGSGHTIRRIAPPRGSHFGALAFAPTGHRLAAAAISATRQARLLELDVDRRHAAPRTLFAGPGSFTQLQWSPGGRWILVSWPAADQWLFVRSAGAAGVSAVRDIARQFDPGRPAPEFPDVAQWCCG